MHSNKKTRHLIIIYFSIILNTLLFTGVAFAGISDGLIAYYSFDDQQNLGKDGSGNVNDGLLEGSPANNYSSDGVSNGAFLMTSATDGMWIPSYSDFQVHVMSISFWFKKDSSTYRGILFARDIRGNASASNQWSMSYNTDNKNTFFYTSRVESIPDTNPAIDVSSEVNQEGWNHIVFTIDPTNTNEGKFYFNGQLVDTQPLTNTNFNNNTEPLTFGMYNRSDSYLNSTGMMDEVRIYNRVLTSSEISELSENIAPKILAWVPAYGMDLSWDTLNSKCDGCSYGLKDVLTHLSIQAWKVTEKEKDGEKIRLSLNDEYEVDRATVEKFITWARDNGIEPLLCIGQGDICKGNAGISVTCPPGEDENKCCYECEDGYEQWRIAKDQYTYANKDDFIAKIISTISSYDDLPGGGLAGVDINFEISAGSAEASNNEKTELLIFMEQLATELHKRGKVLHAAVWPFNIGGAPNPTWYYTPFSITKGLVDITDGIEVMGYENTGAVDNCTIYENSSYWKQENLISSSLELEDLMLGVHSHRGQWCDPYSYLWSHLQWFNSNNNRTGLAIWKAHDFNEKWMEPKVWDLLYAYKNGFRYASPMMSLLPSILSAATIHIDETNKKELEDKANREQ